MGTTADGAAVVNGDYGGSEGGGTSDEDVARRLQQQEDTFRVNLSEHRPTESPPVTPRTEGPTAMLPALESVNWPVVGSVLGSGAFFGCCTGLQLASILGLSSAATWLCSVGGGAAGHVWSRDPLPFRSHLPGPDAAEQESEGEEVEEYANRGLDAAGIDSYTAGHVYSCPHGGAAGSDEDNKCMVCMEIFAAGDELRSLPCMHRYHKRCIDEWLCRSRTCPICKRDITSASVPVSTPMPLQQAPRSPSRWLRWR